MTRRPRPLLAMLAFVLLGTSCTGDESPGQKLEIAVNLFNNAVRWGNINAAAAYVPTDKRDAWVKRRRRLADTISILDYDLVDVRHLAITALDAEVTVSIQWSPKTSNVVETTTLLQKWKYIDTEKRWEMDEQKELEKDKTDDPNDRPAMVEPDAPPDLDPAPE